MDLWNDGVLADESAEAREKTRGVKMKKGVAAGLLLILVLLFGSVALLAQEGGVSSDVSGKLSKIIEGQNEILKQLAGLREELQVVKIRVSNR
ncbi:MAG: hypothetical protein HY593_01080 [Candidatus Omnitrophica bacterium]|nr:hypothetical protein [Candidatus Omnitrophota bacterium]